MYKELQTKTGAEIFILDKEGPPPGHDEMQRIVVLLGAETQVSHATFEIKTVIENMSAENASPPYLEVSSSFTSNSSCLEPSMPDAATVSAEEPCRKARR